MMKVSKGKKGIRTGEKKKKINIEQNADDVETHVKMNNNVDHRMQLLKGKKMKVPISRKRKNKDKNLVERQVEVDLEVQNVDPEMEIIKGKKVKATTSRKRKNKDKNLVGRPTPEDGEVDLEEQNDGVVEHCDSKEKEVQDSKKPRDSNIEAAIKPCTSKQAKKKRRKEVPKSSEKREQNHQDDIHIISSGDDDCSNGMKNSSSSNLHVDDEPEVETGSEKFDWYSQWYPLMPICDLDKRAPHAKKVMGIDVVIWWDRNENAWQVFDDACPHRLAPLSEGRIDQWGRLQCVYHGWCFNGSGDCKFIPQAPPDGPPIHTSKKACVAAYPSTVQNGIVWFWPNTDPQYKDIITRKTPPFIPEIDDPSFTSVMGNRDIAYGYEVLIENLMDPAHTTYAHYGIMNTPKPKVKADREGGRPLDLSIEELDINGFTANQGWSKSKFMPPSIFYAYTDPNKLAPSDETKNSSVQKKFALVFICIPVSPGNSRLIWCFPRNFGLWIDKIVPRWIFHVRQNLVLDSDTYLLHVEEKKIMDVGQANWQKAMFVPTKADALVIGFRKWLKKYAGDQVEWRGKYSGALPPTPPREQLMDRYWSHTVNCKSCNLAYKSLNVVEVMLQIISVASVGIVATMKQGVVSATTRNSMVVLAVLSFALSRWLAHFIYKNFRYHDYNHAFR